MQLGANGVIGQATSLTGSPCRSVNSCEMVNWRMSSGWTLPSLPLKPQVGQQRRDLRLRQCRNPWSTSAGYRDRYSLE
jgi:hypothetical protein